MKKIIAVIGARPQFIKHYPLERASKQKVDLITIHTGQHFDEKMSNVFFDELGMHPPHYLLENGGGSHGFQTGQMMGEIEKIVKHEKPDGVVVYGDTNSTLAGALVAAKLQIPIYHIEAGLRSFNKEMPEEINRILTDHISTKLFVTSEVAIQNLRNEGISEGVHLAGDIMKDVVMMFSREDSFNRRKLDYKYFYATIHRPYNTDDQFRMHKILDALELLPYKVVMALHPRTAKLCLEYEINLQDYNNIKFLEPQSYSDNLSLLVGSEGLITDSGGMQKEAYWLKKKCVTIRKETEWIETIKLGANKLFYDDLSGISEFLFNPVQHWNSELYGNGSSAEQIVDEIIR